MTPDRTTELVLQYASRVSPLWLLVALPAAVGVAWWLYGRERRATTGANAILLPMLRCALVAGLVFLAFRPSLIWREITTWPGRVILLADDSESMAARDTAMPTEEAVLLYRRIHGNVAGVPQHFHDMAADVRGLVRLVHRFRAFSAGGDRRRDAFWDQAEAIQSQIHSTFDDILDTASEITGMSQPLKQKTTQSVDTLKRIRQRCHALFTGDQHPGDEPFDSVAAALREVATTLHEHQAAADRKADGDAADSLERAAEEVRNTARIELLGMTLERAGAELPELLPDQTFQLVRLMQGQRIQLTEFDADDLQPVRGETRIADRLQALLSRSAADVPDSDGSRIREYSGSLEAAPKSHGFGYESDEDTKFPITAVVLLSDGRDLSEAALPSVSQVATRQQVPVSTGAAGSLNEPADVAVLDVVAPPYAVKGRLLKVRVRLAASLPEPGEIKVQLKHGADVLAEETVRPQAPGNVVGHDADDTPERGGIVETVLAVTPEETGRLRYTVEVKAAPGEIFPRRNNSQDLVVHVRDEKVRILFADRKPRWETRFALNIFRRLDYVELNDIIMIVSEDGKLERGAVKGTLPQDHATLQLYDIVVLGALPSDVLTDEEWDSMRRFVEEDGKTLLLLGSSAAALDALDMGGVFKVRSRNREISGPAETKAGRSLTTSATGAGLSDLCVTEAGALHPLTRALGRVLPLSPASEVAALPPESQPLLLAASGKAPIVFTRYTGAGKIAYLGAAEFWKRFNPTALRAHGALYVNSVSWAIDGDALPPDRTTSQLLLDTPQATTRETLQVGVSDPSEGAEVEAVSRGEVVARAPLQRVHPASELGRAVFPPLPAGEVEVRLAGTGKVEPRTVEVLERYPELHFLARNDGLLTSLAADTGGAYGWFTDLPALLSRVEPKARIEKQESVYRLWDARIVFGLVLLGLTVEWIWRKLAGLI